MTLHTHTFEYSTDRPSPSPEDARLDALLADAEAKRARQLGSLRDGTRDLVAIAYSDSVARILTEIRTARRRLREGLYGICAACQGRIARERLDALPWATQCPPCAAQRYR